MPHISTKAIVIATAIVSFTCGVIALALVSASSDTYDAYNKKG